MKLEKLYLIWMVFFIPIIFFQIIYINTEDIYFGLIPIIYPLIIAIAITIKISQNQGKMK